MSLTLVTTATPPHASRSITPVATMAAAPWPIVDGEGRPLIRPQTLGSTAILIGAQPLTPASETLFALLVRMVATPGQRLAAEPLRTMLWPDQADTRQRANLRQGLYKLRQMGVRIALDGDRVLLDPTQLCATFAVTRSREAFERDVVGGTEPFGPFLPTFRPVQPELAEWVQQERYTVHADVRRVLVELLRERRDRVDWTGSTRVARWLLEFDAFNEEATLTLAESLAVSGAKTEAVALLDQYLREVGSSAVELRVQASLLRRRIVEPATRTRVATVPADRHFVGRDDEVATLMRAVRQTKWRQGSATLVSGPPGMGKSRLLQAVTSQAAIEGIRIAQASCRESDLERPLSVFLDWVPELIQWPGALGCDPGSLAALQRLVPAAASARTEPSEPGPRGSLRRALIELLTAIADEKPILLVVEDAHWIDQASWEVLADLIDGISGHAVCLVLTSRFAHPRPQRPQRAPLPLQVLPLPELSVAACHALTEAMSQDLATTVDQELDHWFCQASEGNPLFLRSLISHWAETGAAGGVPPTLQGIIEQRLLALPSEALRVLKTAVLLQRWATPNRIMQTLALRPNELLDSMDHLERTGIVVGANGVVVQVHDLVARGVLDRLSALERSTLYQCTAAILLQDARAASQAEEELITDALEHLSQASDAARLAAETLHFASQIANFREPHAGLRLVERAQGRATAEEKQGLNWIAARLMNSAGDHEFALRLALPKRWDPADAATHTQENAETTSEAISSTYGSQTDTNTASHIEILLSIAGSPIVTVSTRRRAAMYCSVLASSDGREAELTAAFEAASGTESEAEKDLDCASLWMIYHASAGNNAVAVRLSKHWLNYALNSDPSTSSYFAAARAGSALYSADSSNDHLVAYLKAFEIAQHLRAPQNTVLSAHRIALAILTTGDIDSFDKWVSIAVEAHSQTPKGSYSALVHSLLCRQAIERGLPNSAQQFLEEYQNFGVHCTLQDQRYLLCLRGAIGLLEPSWEPDRDLLNELLISRARFARFGLSDYASSIAARLLERIGRSADARLLLSTYVNVERRQIRALSTHLQESFRLLGLDPAHYVRSTDA